MNELARHFLETYTRGAEVDGGWKFAKALQQSRLDYSDASLDRLDRLLAAIRERGKPVRDEYTAGIQGRNFFSLLAFYLMDFVSRRTGAVIALHGFASAVELLPPGIRLPADSSSRIVALADDHGAALLPLRWLEAKLFGDGAVPGARDYIADAVSQLEHNGPIIWWTGVAGMGFLASYAMWMASDGGTVVPTLLRPSPDGTHTFVQEMAEETSQAIEHARAELQKNTGGVPWQALVYDAMLDLRTGRTQAMVVVLHVYGGSPLELSIGFPYRPSVEGRPFAILQPTFLDANVDEPKVRTFGAALQRGIQSFSWPSGSWDRLRETSGAQAPRQAADESADLSVTAPHTTSSQAGVVQPSTARAEAATVAAIEPTDVRARAHAAMRTLADRWRAQVRNAMHFELHCDLAGVEWLDRYLETSHAGGAAAPSLVEGAGAFLGECIVHGAAGQWALVNGKPSVRVETLRGPLFTFPYTRVEKHLQGGLASGDSVLGFYTGILATHAAAAPASQIQERLFEWHRREGVQIHVPARLDAELQWFRVSDIADGMVTIGAPTISRATITLPLNQVAAYYACAPDRSLLHIEGIDRSHLDGLPLDIRESVERRLTEQRRGPSSVDLDAGKRFIAIEYGHSRENEAGRVYYSTTLKNVSSARVKITRFGGFKPDGEGAWTLDTVTGSFFSSQDFAQWYGQPGEWLEPGQGICADANYGHPPVLWAYYGESETGEPFVAGAVIELPPSGKHFVSPRQAEAEFELALGKLRTTFADRQSRFARLTLASIVAPPPPWLRARPKDPLAEVCDRQTLLLAEGKIVWAALIQVNKLMFTPGEDDCPGELAYSEDPYFDGRPGELQDVASRAFRYKGTAPEDPELKRIAELVTDELGRSLKVALPKVFSPRNVQVSTFLAYRKHIPNGVVTAGVFPVLVHPTTPAVMIVPFEFWPIEMIVMWKERRL